MTATDPFRDDFSTLFEFLPIGAYRCLPDGRQLRANPALAAMNGFADEAEQLRWAAGIGNRWYVEPARRDDFRRELDAHGHVTGFEAEVRRASTGEHFWVSENAHWVRDAAGRPLYYEGTVEDITERVQARDALRASRERLRDVLAVVPGMVYQLQLRPDGSRVATFISPGARELFGVEPEDVLRDIEVLTRLQHPDDRAFALAESLAANRAKRRLRIEFRAVLPDGRMKWVQVISAPGEPIDGLPSRVGIALDITAEHEARVLRLERDRAAAANRAKTQFLSRVSHELRTPLNAILGFAQLLDMDAGGDASRRRAWLAHILASGHHLLALMDDILELGTAEAGRLPMQIEPVLLAPLVEQAWAMQFAGRRPIEPLADPGLVVQADRRRLLQVLNNLLSNAIKYNRPDGAVRIEARREPAADGAPARVAIEVADEGPGLSDEQLARLFTPFERLGAERGSVAGTGLGLALTREFVTAMDGSIDVASRLGHGTRFTIRLPAA